MPLKPIKNPKNVPEIAHLNQLIEEYNHRYEENKSSYKFGLKLNSKQELEKNTIYVKVLPGNLIEYEAVSPSGTMRRHGTVRAVEDLTTLKDLQQLDETTKNNLLNVASKDMGLLLQINAAAYKLSKQFQEKIKQDPNHTDLSFLGESNQFMKWNLQRPVATESNDLQNQKLIMITARQTNELPNLEEWQRTTTPLTPGKPRSGQYTRIDGLIGITNALKKQHQADLASRNYELALMRLLKEINIVLNELNDEVPDPNKKKKMKNSFEYLRNCVISELTKLNIEFDKILDMESNRSPLSQKSAAIVLAIENLIKDNKFIEQVNKGKQSGKSPQPITFQIEIEGNRSLRLSYLGGNNNKNWLIEDPDTGEQLHVLRVEDADDTYYSVVANLHQSEAIQEYLASDIFYRPVGGELGSSNIAVSEFCPNGNIFNYLHENKRNQIFNDEEISMHALDFTEQVASFCSALGKEGMGYFDIKAENFLLRENGKVVTADIKSVLFIQPGSSYVMQGDIRTTSSYDPMQLEREIDGKAFEVYQLGLMLYDLMVGTKLDQADRSKSWIEPLVADKKSSARQENAGLNFNFPIFETENGQQIKKLIVDATKRDPEARPKLDNFLERCHELHAQLAPPVMKGTESAASV